MTLVLHPPQKSDPLIAEDAADVRESAPDVRESAADVRESAADIPDCRTCGACCYGDSMWIHVMAGDDDRLGEDRVRHLTVLTQHGRGYFARSMKMEGGRCAAFRDELPDGGGCGCSIYEARPEICRDFDAGTPDCHAARKRRGIES